MTVSKRGQWMLAGGAAAVLAMALAFALVFAPPAIGVGNEAPDFRAVDISTGDTVSFREYRGEVMLINLWATWCPPCEAEMPEIQRLHEELGPEGLKVIAVSQDEQGTDVVRKWIAERKLTFAVLHDQAQVVQDLYHAVGLPESFVVDRRGRIVKRVTGYRVHWDDEAQKALFRRLLERKPDSPT